MGNSEMDKSIKAKEPKTPSSSTPATSQEAPSTASNAMATPDWSGFQAYSPMPPHGFVASSPQPHPYMWGVQPMMSPYGMPPHPYVAMYPPGGIYAHPPLPPGAYPFSPYSMPSPNGIVDPSGNIPGSIEGDGKQSDVKEKLPIKRSRGSLGSLNMINGKNNENGKSSGASANGVYSKSTESATDGTSEGSEANSHDDSGSRQDPKEASQNGGSSHGARNGSASTAQPPVNHTMPVSTFPGPATNLNIGMDYWGGPTSPALPAMHGKVSSTPVPGVVAAGSRDSAQSQLWIQDKRELKRQRRKQSNRESARRSRLRKQADCDELAQRAESLKEENTSLRAELNNVKSEYEQLLAENSSLKDKLMEFPVLENINTNDDDPELENNVQQNVQEDTDKLFKHQLRMTGSAETATY